MHQVSTSQETCTLTMEKREREVKKQVAYYGVACCYPQLYLACCSGWENFAKCHAKTDKRGL